MSLSVTGMQLDEAGTGHSRNVVGRGGVNTQFEPSWGEVRQVGEASAEEIAARGDSLMEEHDGLLLERLLTSVPDLDSPVVRTSRRRRNKPRFMGLRAVLVGLDALAIAVGWVAGAALVGSSFPSRAWDRPAAFVFFLGIVPLALLVNHVFRLYRASACAMHMVEVSLLTRAAAATAVASLAGAQALDLNVADAWVGVSSVLSLALLVVVRGIYRCRLAELRKRGRFVRSIVIVGANDEAFELWRLLQDHPEVGFRACGVVGDPHQHASHPEWAPLLGDLDETVERVQECGATGVFVAATALSGRQLNAICRRLLADGVHVQVASGLRGIDQRRMTPHPVAREPMFYLQAASLSRRQEIMKRAFDLTLGVAILVATLPVLVITAVAVAVHDGRPVFFRQRRVGRDGVPFTIYKFRTMVRDAERRLIDLRPENERQGPLFKLEDDPRVTRLGKLLRDASIDELPQLFNVIRGTMSLVGPRPALPTETEAFEDELLARHQVKPGITGLWQVHSRDNASFSSYQRLDLFYVENWSIAMDLAILATTVPSVMWRGYRRLVRRRGSEPELGRTLTAGEMLPLGAARVPSGQGR